VSSLLSYNNCFAFTAVIPHKAHSIKVNQLKLLFLVLDNTQLDMFFFVNQIMSVEHAYHERHV